MSPVAVKRVIADKRYRIVRDGEELADAVYESLIDYQISIRDEGPWVMRLWNEKHTPKNEESISGEIGEELKQALKGRGVSVTCETKIREGQYVDLYVTAVLGSPNAQRVSLIIEVKGCRHKELKSALTTQLAMRYLKNNGSPHGIYLVAWFLCEAWNDEDRKKKTPKITPDNIRTTLEQQATEVNSEIGSKIRVFVLDATIEGSAKRKRRRSAKVP